MVEVVSADVSHLCDNSTVSANIAPILRAVGAVKQSFLS